MRTLLLTAAILGAALSMADTAVAGPFDGTRCVPTRLSSGRTTLVCGQPIHRVNVFSQRHCAPVYNTYTRRYEKICR